jgi:hypothetical protein
MGVTARKVASKRVCTPRQVAVNVQALTQLLEVLQVVCTECSWFFSALPSIGLEFCS